MTYLVIAFGASIGAIARFYFQKFNAVSNLPVGTILVNLIGSCLLGFFYFYAEKHPFSELYRQFIQIGLLGALTTYSTINLELIILFEKSELKLFIVYFLLNALCGMIALLIGKYIAELF